MLRSSPGIQLSYTTPTATHTPQPRRLSLTDDLDETMFEIPFRELREASHGCRSRRNLAGRLANLLFTDEEKSTSNYRGVLNKKRLDIRKTEAIRKACTSDFPPKQYETSQMVERDIREGVDEMCRRCIRKQKHLDVNNSHS